jgi:hypothetical protein
MAGFFFNGRWVESTPVGTAGYRSSRQTAEVAVANALTRVQNGQCSARDEIGTLLSDHPILKIDVGEDEPHPLNVLIDLFVKEIFE